ncbi:Retrovirus-related Pol polyprotein LINE-1 [Gossypium australe]|uniref:Retrovirus-related Pol polyprotein LINE-1 n=1 Tax=Gossypium australe TaxID=47621 RepID=A0A5B6VPG0_9ROSI|nr:Retrovirus-related Pol polyprotein LINE-1 [Gossypium australe]
MSDTLSSNRLAQVELKIQQELENKANCDWIHIGYHNTKFFHARTLHQRKNSRITAIRNDCGDWIHDSEAIEAEANKFFQNLYGESPDPMGCLPPSKFPCLDHDDISFLGKQVTNEEINVALFDMAYLKGSGSDGFHALFFQKQWNTVGDAVCNWVRSNFNKGTIDAELKNTLIVLTPKVDSLEDFTQYLPISLCSILYNLVMKIIVNRFKTIFLKIIGPEQAGFIAGRNITDNVIIAQELIHSMRSFSKRKWMTIKIDLQKAYNRVPWDFIDASLKQPVLWNRVPLSKFKPARGIRQGCPLSPYHFVLCMDWLGQVIHSAISEGQWNSIRLSQFGPPISHLFFIYDLVIFSKADTNHNRHIKDILGSFCDFSGHKINARKKNIFFAKGVDVTVADSIIQNLGHYLGVLLCHQRVTNGTMHFVVEKVRRKLQSWDTK